LDEKNKGMYKIFWRRKILEESLFGIPRKKWEDNIKRMLRRWTPKMCGENRLKGSGLCPKACLGNSGFEYRN
jgi:hypothetical protein